MLSNFKTTSHEDSSFSTRLGHNRQQNRTELIPLTEIYECETATSSGNKAELHRYSAKCSRSSASQEMRLLL